jgi:hypothetical protein
MTLKENIRAILECNFPGIKNEIIDVAVERIMEISYIQKPGAEKFNREEKDIFLTAMKKEKETCADIHKRFENGEFGFVPEINLVEVCESIERKVKKALWE